MVKVKDLPTSDRTLNSSPVFLYCRICGGESSASRGDYFQFPREHVFICCEKPMILARKETKIVRVVDGAFIKRTEEK